MRHTTHREQAPGRIAGTACLDLVDLSPREQRSHAAALAATSELIGLEALVRVDSLTPSDVHEDVPCFLTDAVRNGISIRFEGSFNAIADWMREVRCRVSPAAATSAASTRRLLQVVGP